MLTFDTPVALHLEDGEMLRWRQARDLRLRVLEGRVWVTWMNEPDDHFLGCSDTLTLHRGAKVLVGAEGGRARLLLDAPARRPHGGWRAAAAQWLAWVFPRTRSS